jgi:enoyl-CoA hydratase
MGLVLFEKDGPVLRVSLNRPTVLNAVNRGVLGELQSGLDSFGKDDGIRALMLFGQGGCFASGADIKELAGLDETGIRDFHRLREKTFSLLEGFPCPTLAVIEGYALGTGLELALSCDFRISAENAQLGIPSAGLGIVESYEYIARLVRAVGPSHARKLLVTAERLNAGTAMGIGLVEEAVASEQLFERAESILSAICRNSPYAVKHSKRLVEMCVKDPNLFYVADTALPMVKSLGHADFKEGTRAFMEKRQAEFQ